MNRRKHILSFIFVILLGQVAFRAASAQQPQTTPSDNQVNAIARQLYCPVCENTPLDVCPTTACAQWRELIRQKLADGWSDQAIKDYFVNQYGARVLGTPPPKGLNLLVYIIPPIAILAGIFVLFQAVRSWKRRVPQAAPSPTQNNNLEGKSPEQDKYIQRLEDEVRKQ
jgi:cytochrome c-type biogenesis protein CcmH